MDRNHLHLEGLCSASMFCARRGLFSVNAVEERKPTRWVETTLCSCPLHWHCFSPDAFCRMAYNLSVGRSVSRPSSAHSQASSVVRDVSGDMNVNQHQQSRNNSEKGSVSPDPEGVKVWLEGDIIKPLDVARPTTYAEATNLAMKHPEYGVQILALPLGTRPPQTQTLESSESSPDSLIPSSGNRRRRARGNGTNKNGRAPRRSNASNRSSSANHTPSDTPPTPTSPLDASVAPSGGAVVSKTAHTASAPNWALAPDSPKRSLRINTSKGNSGSIKVDSPIAVIDAPATSQIQPAVYGIGNHSSVPNSPPRTPGTALQSDFTFAPTGPIDLRLYSGQCTTPEVAPLTLSAVATPSKSPPPAFVIPQPSDVEAMIAALQAARVSGPVSPVTTNSAPLPLPHPPLRVPIGPSSPPPLTTRDENQTGGRFPGSRLNAPRRGMTETKVQGKGFRRTSMQRVVSPPPFAPAGFQLSPDQFNVARPTSGNRAPSPVLPGRRASPFDVGTKLQRPDSAEARMPPSDRNSDSPGRWVTLDEICAMYPSERQVMDGSPHPGYPRARKRTRTRSRTNTGSPGWAQAQE
ncbi:hypothetical protein BXZ70DRAFT_341772 [Cristinia sonorae]|uniref:Uncharacterized protein n=1 Tax=Cristinia sonorae TaxID=1940300 RepID=A0A8K0XNN6_9AGAR|nr:hypothetical protein BXZ70DRAFT_341772 [Cristinia sonorae]